MASLLSQIKTAAALAAAKAKAAAEAAAKAIAAAKAAAAKAATEAAAKAAAAKAAAEKAAAQAAAKAATTKIAASAKRLLDLRSTGFLFSLSSDVAGKQDLFLTYYNANYPNIAPANKIQAVNYLTSNAWLILANKLAPGNLTIRKWALLDLYNNVPANRVQIENQMMLLSYQNKIWSEGYSYWLYLRNVVDVWRTRFPSSATKINGIINTVDSAFVRTAYLRGSVWYPAPYGDLRDVPLNPALQVPHTMQNSTTGIVQLTVAGGVATYKITGSPIGLNLHVPVNTSIIKIVGGIPQSFVFYTGMEYKYKNVASELADLFSPTRIESTFSLF